MAITVPHYCLLKSLKSRLPQGGTLLEIGEANWYGDVNPHRIYDLIDGFDGDNWGEYAVARQVGEAAKSGDLFAVVKAFYAATFAPSRIVSVDVNGTPEALRHDLNYPLPLNDLFDVVINHGTAEHVFNIAQVFKTMHDHCETGGLMIHDAPFTGWVDHGFFCLQPTLFYDMAAVNGYEIVRVVIGEIASGSSICVESREQIHELAMTGKIPSNSLLLVVFKKIVGGPFRIPMQGYYSQAISPEARAAWSRMR